MFSVQSLNISIELWSVVFCFVGIICTILFSRAEGTYRNYLIAGFAMGIVAAGGDALAGIYRGLPGDTAWLATHVGNLATFCGNFLLVAVYTQYLCARLEEVGAGLFTGWRMGVSVMSLVMCACAAFGVFYFIDDQNIYHRSDLFWVSLGYALVVFTVNALLAIQGRKELGFAAFLCLLFYAIAPMMAVAAQQFVYGLNFVVIASIFGFMVLFLEMQAHSARVLQQRTEELARAQTEAAENRIAVMVSQIQPHFLFNTLDTIYGLCDEDANLAKEAIASFSRYLRTNLNSLKRTTPVPIAVELEHVKTYLELERMSDEGRLQYEIDAQDVDFQVPALAVQTIVENAVKHGVGGMERGGSVVVRTRMLPDEHTVTIIDDGIGFAPESVSDDGSHIGLANTRQRLMAMCEGTMDVESEAGRGTTVVMHIPKKEDER